MSTSTAKDIVNTIIALIKGKGLIGQHTHSAVEGGWISTDGSIKHRNPLVKPIDTNSQILNENLNADLWRGHRFYNLNPPPTDTNHPRTDGDLDFDGTNMWVWDSSPTPKWVQVGSAADWNTLLNKPSTFPPDPHNILSTSHGDTTVAIAVNGDILIYNGTWQRLGIGGATQVLTVTAGLPSWAAASATGTVSWARHFAVMGS